MSTVAGGATILRSAGVAALFCGLTVLLMLGKPASQSALEGTTDMESFAVNLSHAQTIPAGTARKIEMILRRPDYDCEQVACGAALEQRNRLARLRLQALLVKSASGDKRITRGATMAAFAHVLNRAE